MIIVALVTIGLEALYLTFIGVYGEGWVKWYHWILVPALIGYNVFNLIYIFTPFAWKINAKNAYTYHMVTMIALIVYFVVYCVGLIYTIVQVLDIEINPQDRSGFPPLAMFLGLTMYAILSLLVGFFQPLLFFLYTRNLKDAQFAGRLVEAD